MKVKLLQLVDSNPVGHNYFQIFDQLKMKAQFSLDE